MALLQEGLTIRDFSTNRVVAVDIRVLALVMLVSLIWQPALPGCKMGDLPLPGQGYIPPDLLNPTWCLQPPAVEITFLLLKGRLPTLSPEQTAPSAPSEVGRAL